MVNEGSFSYSFMFYNVSFCVYVCKYICKGSYFMKLLVTNYVDKNTFNSHFIYFELYKHIIFLNMAFQLAVSPSICATV
jgi:hypothetical protein